LRSELAFAIITSKGKNPDVKTIRSSSQLDPLQKGQHVVPATQATLRQNTRWPVWTARINGLDQAVQKRTIHHYCNLFVPMNCPKLQIGHELSCILASKFISEELKIKKDIN
jgi:hypothetical protein